MKKKLLKVSATATMAFLTAVFPAFAQVSPDPNPPLEQTCGLDIVLVLDSSGSIDDTELATMKGAFEDFVDAFLPGNPTEMAIVEFDDQAFVQQGFTDNATDLKTAINGAVSGGFTNWDDALHDARSLFPNRNANPDLIVFASDGNPNRIGGHDTNPVTSPGEAASLDAAIEEANLAKGAGIRIITLGIGNDLDTSSLEDISSADALITSDFDTLADDLAELAAELCDPDKECVHCGTEINVAYNDNEAYLENNVSAQANTGGNWSGGSYAGDGGDGGNINNSDEDVRDSRTGRGGNGGSSGVGGTVISGDALAEASVNNRVNWNETDIQACPCEADCCEYDFDCGCEGDRECGCPLLHGPLDLNASVNINRARLSNRVMAQANTGENNAEGSEAGEGGDGGNINNQGEDVDNSTTGIGGTGGNSGPGGYVETGRAVSRSNLVNVINTNVTRIHR